MDAALINIREATPEDNKSLVDLVKTSPMEGMVSAYVDRDPDFFALPRMQGEHYRMYVADYDGRVVGCFTQIERTELWNGSQEKVIYTGDLRIHPEFRSLKIIKAFAKKHMERLRIKNYHHGLADVIKGNKAGEGVQHLLSEVVDIEPAGTVHLYQVLPVIPPRVSGEYQYRQATQDDFPAVVNLLKECYVGYNGTPDFQSNSFKKQFHLHPSFCVESLWIAEKNGTIVACSALWDQEDFRRTVVMKYSSALSTVVQGFKLVRPLLGIPKIPAKGDPLKYVFIRYPGCIPGEEEALKNLIRKQVKMVREQMKYHFVWISFHEQDPLKKVINGLLKTKVEVKMFHHLPKDMDQASRSVMDIGIPWADFSLV